MAQIELIHGAGEQIELVNGANRAGPWRICIVTPHTSAAIDARELLQHLHRNAAHQGVPHARLQELAPPHRAAAAGGLL
ncbi:unnamed protein product [Miscanthus lutarioriparius]|uniref:Uncharacterized protein n=1 Tax=Miscanthus lutarioriparius TaxID=422564 RepID=A0A811N3L8_9POAL|nr:unnamed protein product [Miscanthus lutarioriparius]